jgi:hypothetical protein
MKILSQPSNEHTSARSDARAKSHGYGRQFPRTDYCYRSISEDAFGARSPIRPDKTDLRAFRNMSEDLMAEDARRNILPEILTFGLVIGVAAWSLISLLVVLSQTGYG